MPGIVNLTRYNFIFKSSSELFYPKFTDEEAEAQKVEVLA